MRVRNVERHWLTSVLILATIGLVGFHPTPRDARAALGDGAETAVLAATADTTDRVAGRTGGGGASNPWLVVALIAMASATLLSVAVSFYLYRWRRILLANPHMLVPEELGGVLERMGAKFDGMSLSFETGVDKLARRSAGTDEAVANLVETFMTLQQALDQRDAEIRRLKKGYDTEIFRRFVGRFIRVDQAIDDFMRDEAVTAESLDQIKRVLEDAFDECGVESFEPTIGADYRESDGVADNPKLVEPNDPDDAFRIVEVLDVGYRLGTPEGFDVILPAKVSIYGTKK